MRIKIIPQRTTFEQTWKPVQKPTKSIERFESQAEEDRKAMSGYIKKLTDAMEKDLKAREKEREAREKDLEAREKEREEMRKSREEMNSSIKAMQKELGGITKSNGEMAESYFINSFSLTPKFAGQTFQFVDANTKRSAKALNLKDEYDLLLYNGVSVAIIEIKYKARKKDVEHLLKKTKTFKILFPQYKDFDLYIGLAALHFDSETEIESLEQGIAVIKQIGDNMVINDAHLKVF